ncbi:hypothetical protein KEM55_000597 [Ascosphaera atra]|nr:hypothetical protein KEM55_000597 [Ascosphaera atra]
MHRCGGSINAIKTEHQHQKDPSALMKGNDNTLSTLLRINKELIDAEYIDWQRGKVESEAFVEECKKALMYFELHDKARAEMDERDRQVVMLAKAQEEIRGSIEEIEEEIEEEDEGDSNASDEDEEGEESQLDDDEAIVSHDSDDAGYDSDWRGF